MLQTDFLIIGSGIAGLSLALNLAERGRVSVVTKKALEDSNTNYAQGGVASVLGDDDSFDLHVADTLAAGAGLCRRDVVEMVVREGPARIRDLESLGVAFTTEAGRLALGLEGGHSRHRIVHNADHTGREVETHLLDAVLEHERIDVHPYHMAIDLIAPRHLAGAGARGVWGAYAMDAGSGEVRAFVAKRTILATGGAGKVYRYTTNPDIATGDGVAMAYRVGATIANLEFVQFHPTCLYHPRAKSFLLTEALRGEGGRLVDGRGARFMERYDPRGELAPRDIVARAIDSEMKRTAAPCVYLDITHLSAAHIERRFPSILDRCLGFGIDPRTTPIPVVPATHYFCGGVDVDDRGRTSIENLFAIGEASHTGLHGANRLASNSLLEAAVYAGRAYQHAVTQLTGCHFEAPEIPVWDSSTATNSDEMVVVSHNWDEIRRFMWNYVGIVRSDKRLERAKRRITLIQEEIEDYYWDFIITSDLVELRNIATVAELIISCAQSRQESRGLHYNIDHPQKDDIHWRKDTFIKKQF